MGTREQLLQVALSQFGARGYDAVGVQEICDAAQVTKPTLYHYFGSKRGLLDALVAEESAGLLAVLGEAADYHHDVPFTLERVARACFRYAAEHRASYLMQLGLLYAPPESEAYRAVSALHAQQRALLERLFELAAEDHGNMRGRQRAYAATYLGMINTYIGLWLEGAAELNDDLVYRAGHQFMHGIYS